MDHVRLRGRVLYKRQGRRNGSIEGDEGILACSESLHGSRIRVVVKLPASRDYGTGNQEKALSAYE